MEISDIMIPHAGRTDGARGFWEQTEKQGSFGAPLTWMILWRAAGEAAAVTPMSYDLSKASIRSTDVQALEEEQERGRSEGRSGRSEEEPRTRSANVKHRCFLIL